MSTKRLICVAVVVAGVAGYWAAKEPLRQRLERKLSASLQRPVKIGQVGYGFPLGLRLKSLVLLPGQRPGEIPIQIKWAKVEISGVELVEPTFSLKISPEGVSGVPSWAGGSGRGLPFAGLRIRKGHMTLTDQKVTPEVVWTLSNLNLRLKRGPDPRTASVSGQANLLTARGESMGEIRVQGELLPAGMVQGKADLRHNQIGQAAPYLRQALGTAPSQGSCRLTSEITTRDGTIIAKTELQAKEVAFATDVPTSLGPPGNKLVEMLEDPNGEIQLSFLVTRKKGEPLDWSNLASAALGQALRQALARNIQKLLTDAEEVQPIQEKLQQGLESLGR